MADLIDTLTAQTARIDRLLSEVATMRGTHEADTRELRTALAGLTDALIDLTASVTALDKQAAVAAGKSDTREETLTEVRRKLGAILGTLERIAVPLLAAEEARASAEANKQHLFTQLTPQRVAWVVAFIVSIAAAGGFGANFRGCAAVLQTTADDVPNTQNPQPPATSEE